MLSEIQLRNFHSRLHGWFLENGRDLPWRRNHSPYAVMVSEFMLQQTTVAAAGPFFERWMARFPDVKSLAAAGEADVLAVWQGLGYYSRARRLLQAAREVARIHDGDIPGDPRLLATLPGIGPYTAAAISAFAFDRCLPVLDANIIRVLARLADFTGAVTTAAGKRFLETQARALLPESGGSLHTSSLMELGATICRSGVPDCAACPVHEFCRAREPAQIPLKPPPKPVIQEVDLRAFASSGGKVYLVPSAGPRWKGLWLLPPAQSGEEVLVEFGYVVTRHRIRLSVFPARAQAGWVAFDARSLPPMPVPHRRALDKLLTGAE